MSVDYRSLTLPELYAKAYQKGIVNFFGKVEEEMVKMLTEWDEEHGEEESKLKTSSPKTSAPRLKPQPKQKKKGFREAIERMVEEEEDFDELLDVEDFDAEDETDGRASERVSKRLGIGVKDKTGRTDETLDDDTDDFLNDMFDDKPEEEESTMATKPATEKAAAAPKKAAPAPKAAAPAKKAVASTGRAVSDKAPYVEGTAGFCVFSALKKGGTMDAIVSNADALIAKAGAKPPSNTADKVKIIMTEINKGKKGDAWGRFSLNEKTGKISHVPA
jgi:hypothetical protein